MHARPSKFIALSAPVAGARAPFDKGKRFIMRATTTSVLLLLLPLTCEVGSGSDRKPIALPAADADVLVVARLVPASLRPVKSLQGECEYHAVLQVESVLKGDSSLGNLQVRLSSVFTPLTGGCISNQFLVGDFRALRRTGSSAAVELLFTPPFHHVPFPVGGDLRTNHVWSLKLDPGAFFEEPVFRVDEPSDVQCIPVLRGDEGLPFGFGDRSGEERQR